MGLPDPLVRSLTKSLLAWRRLLRSPDEKAHISYGEARLLLADLP
uniref:Uncharacterized protein n=1 Tax=Ciceribacter selenitireducens ATCC BAA-1503 TaxID=1336235 RepID=A0A380TMV6_9HYPH|nr:unnamed protein product [Ciceribacter selenitireducens ATCC BAA-1503]